MPSARRKYVDPAALSFAEDFVYFSPRSYLYGLRGIEPRERFGITYKGKQPDAQKNEAF